MGLLGGIGGIGGVVDVLGPVDMPQSLVRH